MIVKKTDKKLFLLFTVILCAVVTVAQLTTGGQWFRKLFSAPSATVIEKEGNGRRTNDDPWKELEHIYQMFHGGSYVYSGKIKLTDDEGTVLEDVDFSCEQAGNDYHYSIDSVEMIHKGNFSLNVYHREKMMVAGNEKNPASFFRMYSNMDSLKKIAARDGVTTEVLQNREGKVIAINNTGHSDVYGYEIYYHPTGYKVKKVVLLLATPEDVDSYEGVEEKAADGEETAGETETDNGDSDTTTTSIEFNLYRMEIYYNQFQITEAGKDFDPLKKYITVSGSGMNVNSGYNHYRMVWMDDGKEGGKRKKSRN